MSEPVKFYADENILMRQKFDAEAGNMAYGRMTSPSIAAWVAEILNENAVRQRADLAPERKYDFSVWPSSEDDWYYEALVQNEGFDTAIYSGRAPTYSEAMCAAQEMAFSHPVPEAEEVPANLEVKLRQVGASWTWVVEIDGKPLFNGAATSRAQAFGQATASMLVKGDLL